MGPALAHVVSVLVAFSLLAAAAWDGRAISESVPPQARLSGSRASIHLSPGSEPSGLHLRGRTGERFSVLGRSFDSRWIALRRDNFDPAYAWIPSDQLELNVSVEVVPIVVGTGMEVISVEEDGRLGDRYVTSDGFDRWKWRDDNTIVGSNESGLWHLNPETGLLRRVSDQHPVRLSPDGMYAAAGPAHHDGLDFVLGDITIIPVDGGRPLVFRDVARYSKWDPRGHPSVKWSKDSKHVLSVILGTPNDKAIQFHVLGVDGSHSLIKLPIPAWGAFGWYAEWLNASRLAIDTFENISLFTLNGRLIEVLDYDEVWLRYNAILDNLARLSSDIVTYDPFWIVLAEHASGVRLVDERVPLSQATLQLERTEPGSRVRIPGIDSSITSDGDFSRDGTRVAARSSSPWIYIIEVQTAQIVSDFTVQGNPFRGGFDLSPDGNQVIVGSWKYVAYDDELGFAAFLNRSRRLQESHGVLAEYVIIDVATGETLRTFRADGNVEFGGHRAEWSPDGKWLAFGGDDERPN